MYSIVIVLSVLVSILLILIVLVQKSKGGGLSSQFGNAGSVMGVRQTNSFLEKTTWTLVGLIFVLSVVSAYMMPKASDGVRVQQDAPAAPANPTGNQYGTETAPAAPASTPVIPAE